MKTKNTQNQTKVAVLSAALNAASGDGWYQLLPAGKFKARDGRPFDTKDGYWFLDENIASAFIARTIDESKGKKVLIDYDHQTLYKDETGQKAPAAGRIVDPANDIIWRNDGIYIRPRWTPIAQAEIDNEQYSDLSAVFPYNEDGHPLYLRMAAITNDPGLLEINSLVALAAELFNENQPTQQETKKMNELLRTLLIAIGVLSADEKAEELTEERLKEIGAKAVENITALKAASAAAVDIKTTIENNPAAVPEKVEQAIDDAGTEIATAEEIIAEATLHSIDLSKAVPLSVYQKAVNKIAALSAGNAQMTVEQLIEQGRKAGKVIKANEGYLTALGKTQGVAALSAALNACTPIAALAAKQTANVTQPQKPVGVAVLSAEQKEAARLQGKSEAEYLTIIQKESK